MADDSGVVVLEEKAVLEKFEGDPANGVLLERITLLDGVIVEHEFFNKE